MAILERFADIIKANINDLLDKCEDPAKMIDQYLRDLTEDLAEVKKETAAVMAEETRTRRMLEENTAEVKRYEELAKKALTAGNEGDARVFLGKKQQLADKAASLQATYDAAHANAEKMRQMHDKLVGDIETLHGRREMVKAKMAVAKTQEKVNKVGASADKAVSYTHLPADMARPGDVRKGHVLHIVLVDVGLQRPDALAVCEGNLGTPLNLLPVVNHHQAPDF